MSPGLSVGEMKYDAATTTTQRPDPNTRVFSVFAAEPTARTSSR